MKNTTLAQSYLIKARLLLRLLSALLEAGGYSDVVREAQEIVELALKGMLRQVGVEPSKWHDVGPFLLEHRSRFPADVVLELETLAEISRWLRREREFAFYGEVDLIPTEQYTRQDAERALADARKVVQVASQLIPLPGKSYAPPLPQPVLSP
ncbi:MAG: HEPN domain-containing protein [Chloroflexia bacterium]